MRKIKISILIILIVLPLTVLALDEFNLESLFLNTNTTTLINIKSVDLIWSVDTYVPLSYEGRNLPVKGSKIDIEAIINTISGNTSGLKFSWFLEDTFQSSKSGYNRDNFSFYVTQLPGLNHTIQLQVFNDDRSIFIEKSIEIPVVEPEIIVYSTKGNSHFSNQASKISTILSNKEFSFVAKPYFFSIKKLTDLTFEWNLPGQSPITSSAYNASVLNLTIANTSATNESQEESLWVSATNTKDPRQQASQSLKLKIY